MSIPDNKFPTPEPTGDPKIDNAGQDVITNSEESDKVVNTDGAAGSVADMDCIQETLSGSELSSSATADSAEPAEQEAANGDTATDADVAGGNPVI
ncbi:hypothetical protein [Mucilaginibacter glaciei]|uniref:Uncharacterized protein n=1 Tax=Mucilaginibacter glaciei TaxID=2772109 RepID=A0A926NN93_9SPHI|nr:hypothetical protein [Mucilaginibacter glaciei]MBD1392866.1 hypothetical protein [Mucilaginibacter glaciei]